MKHAKRFSLMQNFDRLWLPAALVVALLAVINILLGHALTGVLIILFCLAALAIKRPNMVLLAVPIVLVLIFRSQPLNTFGDLREQFTGLMSKPGYFLTSFFTPGSGLEVLPDQALQVQELIDQYDLRSYQLSNALMQEDEREIKERIIESAWPVRVDEDSPYEFGYPGDFTGRTDCQVLDSRQDIELGYCD